MSDNDDVIKKEVKYIYPDSEDKEQEEQIPHEETSAEVSADVEDDDFDMSPDEEFTATDPYGEPDILSEEIKKDNDEYTPNQDTLINQAEASKKEDPNLSQKKNEGYFFDRQKVFVVVGVAAILGIFFMVFALPYLSKDKTKKEKKMQQASKTWQSIDEWVEPAKDDEEIDTSPYNSSDVVVTEENDDEEEIPEPKIEPVSSDDDSGSSRPKRPITNANEQQKAVSRLQLDDYSSRQRDYNNVRVRDNSQTQQGGYNSPYAQVTGGNSYAYTPAALNDNIGRYMASLSGDNYDRQNNQSGKNEFFKSGGAGGQYQWNSEYTLWKGTIIPAVLETSINSDLPGIVIATVTTNVYSSLDGKHLLIPQGSKLYAEYSSSISYGQDRIQVIWNTLIRPDGLEVNLGGLNGVDPTGTSGYKGHKTNHPFEFLKAMGLIACFSIVDTKLNNQIANSSNAYQQNMLNDTYAEVKKLNNKIVERALDIQPTVRIASGKKVDLITNVSMDLPPLQPYPVDKKYKRN